MALADFDGGMGTGAQATGKPLARESLVCPRTPAERRDVPRRASAAIFRQPCVCEIVSHRSGGIGMGQDDAWARVTGKGIYPVEYASMLLTPWRNLILPPSRLI